VNIRDDAVIQINVARGDEFLCGRKAPCAERNRAEELNKRYAERFVVVDYSDQALCRHTFTSLELTALEQARANELVASQLCR
jgi:hypothetical protein